jgi:hypothetical protein
MLDRGFIPGEPHQVDLASAAMGVGSIGRDEGHRADGPLLDPPTPCVVLANIGLLKALVRGRPLTLGQQRTSLAIDPQRGLPPRLAGPVVAYWLYR